LSIFGKKYFTTYSTGSIETSSAQAQT